MDVPLKSEYLKSVLASKYFLKFEKHLVHLKKNQPEEHHPDNSTDKPINLVITG